MCIEDSYISVGDDLIAVKSGWDEYGISYNAPSSNITIRRVTGSSPFGGIAVGSEMSGGVENIVVEDITLFNMGIGIHIKTNIGRGAFIRDITVSNVRIEKARKGIKIAGNVGDHPDGNYDANALPVVKGITMRDFWGVHVQQAGMMKGIRDSPFTGICLSNINLEGDPAPREGAWSCSDVSGSAYEVSPWPCSELTSISQSRGGYCATSF